MSSSAACCLTIDSIEAGEANTFMGEARYNIDQSYKFPNGTSFDAILDFFPPKADYFLDSRNIVQDSAWGCTRNVASDEENFAKHG
jgi:hypothetical protein